jgi:hypothetical protein
MTSFQVVHIPTQKVMISFQFFHQLLSHTAKEVMFGMKTVMSSLNVLVVWLPLVLAMPTNLLVQRVTQELQKGNNFSRPSIIEREIAERFLEHG